jgi:hypothetical protein
MGDAKKKLTMMRTPSANGNGKQTAGKKAAGQGASRLSEAAGKTLEENSSEIAQSLLDSTLKGNASSARLLVELAEGPAESKNARTKRRTGSMAKKLAAEPEWGGGTAIESMAESSAGQIEVAG